MGRGPGRHQAGQLNATFERFVAEIAADARTADGADDLRRQLEALFDLAADNVVALELCDGLTWILRQRRHSVEERLMAIHKLLGLQGQVRINLREFLQW
jgi:hypothetical protein